MPTTTVPSSTAPRRPGAKARIIAAAAELFYRAGVRAVGIDAVIERAGVAKMSLYRAFSSKDALVAAFLEDADRRYWQWFEGVLARHPGEPRRQLLALFTALAKATRRPDYRGCPFVNTAVEFPEPDHPGRRVAEANKRELRRRLGLLTAALAVPQPDQLADQLLLLMEGAYSLGNTLGQEGPTAAVVAAAERLIDSQTEAAPAATLGQEPGEAK